MGLGFLLTLKQGEEMKKTLSIMLLSVCCAFNAQAQLARGYYRVQNTYTNRYISIEDNNSEHYPVSNSGSVNMSGIKTYKPGVKVSTSPSTIIYVYNVGGTQYDMEGQGSSIHYLTGGRTYVNLEIQSDGSYQAYGSYAKVKLYLKDDSDPDAEEAYLKPNSKSEKAMNWWAKPVDTGNEYLGILPDVEVGGKYYGTIFAAFPFRLVSSGMKAYCVTAAAGSGFTLQEITGDIPASTPVIVECSSNSPANNMILPVETDPSLGYTNLLYGVYCDRVSSRFVNAQMYDANYFRTIGSSGGKLAFVKAKSSDLTEGAYLKANKAYLLGDPSNASDVLVLGGSTDPNPGPGPEPEKEFTEEGIKYSVGSNNTAGIADIGTLEPGYYEVPSAVLHNSQYYTIIAIMQNAFANQTGLTSISLPYTITYIGEKAFAGCSNLSVIYAFMEEPATVVGGAAAFEGVDFENCILNVPAGCVDKYKAADGWSSFKNIVDVTGIREIKNETKGNDRWYSLDGRELKSQPTMKGIYIKNGKKVVVK